MKAYFSPDPQRCIFCGTPRNLKPVNYCSVYVSEVTWSPGYNRVETQTQTQDAREFSAGVCTSCWKGRMHKSITALYSALIVGALGFAVYVSPLRPWVQPLIDLSPPIFAIIAGCVVLGAAFAIVWGVFLLLFWVSKFSQVTRRAMMSLIPRMREGFDGVTIASFVIEQHRQLAGKEQEESRVDPLSKRPLQGYRRFYEKS